MTSVAAVEAIECYMGLVAADGFKTLTADLGRDPVVSQHAVDRRPDRVWFIAVRLDRSLEFLVPCWGRHSQVSLYAWHHCEKDHSSDMLGSSCRLGEENPRLGLAQAVRRRRVRACDARDSPMFHAGVYAVGQAARRLLSQVRTRGEVQSAVPTRR